MLKILFTFVGFINLVLFAQSHAWFVGQYRGADLLLVEMAEDSCHWRQAFKFADTLEVVQPGERMTPHGSGYDPLPRIFNAGTDSKFPASPVGYELPGGGGYVVGGDTSYLKQYYAFDGTGITSIVVDTLIVEGKQYTIHQQLSDDGFIGGRPSAVHQHIAVSGLGIIYSYENWFDAHLLFMFCHEDPAKQRVLQAVYEHLETTNSWQPWKKIAAMARSYSFNTCVAELTAEWMATRNHLQLISASYENIGQEIHASVTIKNISDIHYAFPIYFSIAPAEATIHYSDTTALTWDLLDTHYGEHMKQMKQEVYLSPGEEISFSYTFRMHYSGNSIRVTYDGFQVNTPLSYLDWLLQDPKKCLGNEYLIYPHREIRPGE